MEDADGVSNSLFPSPDDNTLIVEPIAAVIISVECSFLVLAVVVDIIAAIVPSSRFESWDFSTPKEAFFGTCSSRLELHTLIATRAKGGNCDIGSRVRRLSCESASRSLLITPSIGKPNRIANINGIGPLKPRISSSLRPFAILLVAMYGNGKSTVDCKYRGLGQCDGRISLLSSSLLYVVQFESDGNSANPTFCAVSVEYCFCRCFLAVRVFFEEIGVLVSALPLSNIVSKLDVAYEYLCFARRT